MKLVVFDLDGTLLNTIEDIRRAVNYALHAFEVPGVPDAESMKKLVGNGLRRALAEAINASGMKIGEQEQGLMLELLTASYRKHPVDNTYPYEGIPALLAALEEKGIAIAILSNKKDDLVKEIVRRLLPEHAFLFVLGEGSTYPRKPDPTSLNAMLKQYDIAKDEVVYVGDSEVDRKTADNAGVKGIIVSYGFRTEEELKEAGILESVPTVEALRKVLGL